MWEPARLARPEVELGGDIMNENKLAELRRGLNLTQDELADRAGVSKGAIGKIETGKQIARPGTRKKLCLALKLPFKRHVEIFGPMAMPGPKPS